MLYANLLLNVLYHIEIEMKIRESCLQTGNFIYKPGISLTKQDFHLQRGILGLQRGFSGYYLPRNKELLEEYVEKRIQARKDMQEFRTKEYFKNKEQNAELSRKALVAKAYEQQILEEH